MDREGTSMTARIAVLASGTGTNLQSLIDHFAEVAPDAGTMVWVGSNRADAFALSRARAAGIETGVIVDPADGASLRRQLSAARVDLIVLAGYLKLVPADVVTQFEGRLLNIHPSLLPAFGGPNMYGQRVHAAVIAHGARVSGATVHFVDEVFDRGAIVAQWPVRVFADDTPSSLAARVLRAEHRLLPLTVEAVASGRVTLGPDGRVHGDVPLPPLPE